MSSLASLQCLTTPFPFTKALSSPKSSYSSLLVRWFRLFMQRHGGVVVPFLAMDEYCAHLIQQSFTRRQASPGNASEPESSIRSSKHSAIWYLTFRAPQNLEGSQRTLGRVIHRSIISGGECEQSNARTEKRLRYSHEQTHCDGFHGTFRHGENGALK